MIVFCITEEANGWKEENKKSIENSINLLIFKPNKWCISLNLHLRLHWFRRKTFSPNSIFHIFRCLVQLKMLVKPKKKFCLTRKITFTDTDTTHTHPPPPTHPPTHSPPCCYHIFQCHTQPNPNLPTPNPTTHDQETYAFAAPVLLVYWSAIPLQVKLPLSFSFFFPFFSLIFDE